MPLSDHEQRMLDQIESALYAEDPKFASSVRGGGLRAPTARRRLQGVGLFVLGLAMLVSGVAFKATMIGTFPILSVVGFVVMFGGVVFAITGRRLPGRGEPPGPSAGARQRRGRGPGGSFTSRMEDRFRRRFEE
jgi:cytochrome c biogenesis protein CcdA